MLVFDLIGGLIQLAVLGGSAVFLWQDYKNDFTKSKLLLTGVTRRIQRLTGRKETEVEIANKAVENWAKQIARLREALASVEASRDQSLRRSQEQKLLTADFHDLLMEALRKEDEDAMTAAAFGKIQAEARFQLFVEHARTNSQAAKMLAEELDGVELEFETARTQADTIQVYAEIGGAEEQLYGLVSNFTADGLTPRAQLEQSLLTTEHKKLKAGHLVDLATRRSGQKRIDRFKQATEVQRGINEARNTLALNPAPQEGDNNGKDNGNNRDVIIPVQAEVEVVN